jgi:hypothetical protein
MLFVYIADADDPHAWIVHEDLHGGEPLPTDADAAEVDALAGQDVGAQDSGRADTQEQPTIHRLETFVFSLGVMSAFKSPIANWMPARMCCRISGFVNAAGLWPIVV